MSLSFSSFRQTIEKIKIKVVCMKGLPKYLKDLFKLLPEVRGLKLEVALVDAVLTSVGVVEKDLVLIGV